MNVKWFAPGLMLLLTIFNQGCNEEPLPPGKEADVQEQLIVASGARVEKLAGDFMFTEGPAINAAGDIYFSDIPNNRIHIWAGGKLVTFRENSGGANGLFFDRAGNLITCEGGNRRITSIDPLGRETVLAAEYDGRMLNSPNDLWIDPLGGIYFSDPRYGDRAGMEQGGEHVYYLSPDRKKLTRVISDMQRPNGLIGTPDGKILYVADHGAGKTYNYNIEADGTLSGKEEFTASGSDGMTIDSEGNIYLTADTVIVFNQKGEKIASITVPERPANICFGGPDKRTLYITARTSLYSIRMRTEGI